MQAEPGIPWGWVAGVLAALGTAVGRALWILWKDRQDATLAFTASLDKVSESQAHSLNKLSEEQNRRTEKVEGALDRMAAVIETGQKESTNAYLHVATALVAIGAPRDAVLPKSEIEK